MFSSLFNFLITRRIVFLMAYTQTHHKENKILNRRTLFKFFAYQNIILKREERINFIFTCGGGNNLSWLRTEWWKFSYAWIECIFARARQLHASQMQNSDKTQENMRYNLNNSVFNKPDKATHQFTIIFIQRTHVGFNEQAMCGCRALSFAET